MNPKVVSKDRITILSKNLKGRLYIVKETKFKKKLIRRIAIIFLGVLLLLTFFSNTIMNHSLPQVSTQEIAADKVSSKVRGSGMVQTQDPYIIKIQESREISEVLVKEGDDVNPGDVLLRFTEASGSEVEVAERELEELKNSYNYGILSGEIKSELVSQAENGGLNYAEAKSRLSELSMNVTSAADRVKELQAQQQALENGTSQYALNLKNAEEELAKANDDVAKAENAFSIYGMEEAEVMDLYSQAPDQNVINAKNALDALVNAKNAVVDKTAAQTAAEKALNSEKERVANELAAAQQASDTATTEHDKYVSEMGQVNELKSQYDTIKQKEADLEKLKANSVGTEITSEVAGSVVSVMVKKGDKTEPDMELITIKDNTKGNTLTITVTKEQASKVKKGDVATPDNSWYYNGVTFTLSAIKNDTSSHGSNKQLVFDITGDVEVGQNVTLSIGDKSMSYDYVVPNGAVREDKNGKFILIIQAKNSPLGNRYVAKRVDVEVVLSDDANSAVKGALEGGEYVITTSSKSIKAGDYVRLAK